MHLLKVSILRKYSSKMHLLNSAELMMKKYSEALLPIKLLNLITKKENITLSHNLNRIQPPNTWSIKKKRRTKKHSRDN